MKIADFIRFLKNNFWRITISVIAISFVVIAVLISVLTYKDSHAEYNIKISENLGFRYNHHNGGYVYNLKTNEKIIPDVSWVVAPKNNDSIAVFHCGEKRGYFNTKIGEIIVQPKYEAAWLFRSGIGAVALNDSVFFIGLDGKPINNKKFPRIKGEDYLFEGDYCIIKVGSKYGAIDKSGEWVLQPEWEFAESTPQGVLIAWENKMPIYIYDKSDIRPYLRRIEIKGDTIISYTDSIRIYMRDLEIEKRE